MGTKRLPSGYKVATKWLQSGYKFEVCAGSEHASELLGQWLHAATLPRDRREAFIGRAAMGWLQCGYKVATKWLRLSTRCARASRDSVLRNKSASRAVNTRGRNVAARGCRRNVSVRYIVATARPQAICKVATMWLQCGYKVATVLMRGRIT